MTTKDIRTTQAHVSCDVCGRTLLRGERAETYIAGGTRREVCELCQPRALHEGWVREGAVELFEESVRLHAPLLPVLGTEDSRRTLLSGGVPSLAELRLHHGTVWRWNRAVYDPDGGGHLRIEYRALPAGPTVIDMLASAAFLLGTTLGLAPEVDRLLPAYPFELARHAFHHAA